MTNQLNALVMAGGRGTRFWPESTSKKPKQYLALTGDKPLLTKALERFDGLVPSENRYIVTVSEQKELVYESSKGMIGDNGVIFEPAGRNTAPCILLSLASLIENGASMDDVIAVVPSDHIILNTKGFQKVIAQAKDVAVNESKIVTIGIAPTFPHTGYGYIHRGENLVDRVFKVQSFKEKPDVKTATSYLETGEYYWNAGMFVSSIKTFLEEFEKHAPEVFTHFNNLKSALGNESALKDAYMAIPKNSIDYAVMEKSDKVMVIESEFDWNDLGSWDALETVIDKTDDNIVASAESSYFQEAKGNIVYAPEKFVSLVGVNDLIVVSGKDAVMVLPKERSQDVKKIVEHLEGKGRTDLL